MPATPPAYRGRFAPSPTGPLHLGSLIAALASFLDARAQSGTWLVRMEDLDPPREQAGAADAILQSLEDHGLFWDDTVLWQSQRHDAYADALQTLARKGLLFDCDCTRAALGPGGACAGRCPPRQATLQAPTAVRIAVPAQTHINFDDGLQGQQISPLGTELPDFSLQRKDGLYAYQLAVVVDDGFQDITHVVRGSDLLDSTPRQHYLQSCLDLRHPGYAHIPVITNDQGQKFSKQNHAPPLTAPDAPANLRAALAFLNQPAPPPELDQTADLLQFAISHWDLSLVPAAMAVAAEPQDRS